MKFDLSAWDNKDSTKKASKMTWQQAEARNGIRYRVYLGNRLLKAFNRSRNWPFIWNDGVILSLKTGKYRVERIQPVYWSSMTKVYVKKIG